MSNLIDLRKTDPIDFPQFSSELDRRVQSAFDLGRCVACCRWWGEYFELVRWLGVERQSDRELRNDRRDVFRPELKTLAGDVFPAGVPSVTDAVVEFAFEFWNPPITDENSFHPYEWESDDVDCPDREIVPFAFDPSLAWEVILSRLKPICRHGIADVDAADRFPADFYCNVAQLGFRFDSAFRSYSPRDTEGAWCQQKLKLQRTWEICDNELDLNAERWWEPCIEQLRKCGVRVEYRLDLAHLTDRRAFLVSEYEKFVNELANTSVEHFDPTLKAKVEADHRFSQLDVVIKARVELIRELFKSNTKLTRAPHEKIRGALREKCGHGSRRATLIEALDFLRSTGEYLVPAKRRVGTRKKNSKTPKETT